MTKQEAILRMMIPMAKNLFEKRADWDEIDQQIDACADLYDRIAKAYPEEDEDEEFDDDLEQYGFSSDWDEKDVNNYKEQMRAEFVEKKETTIPEVKHEFNIVHGKFDETVSKEESELIDKFMEIQEQYIPYVEEKEEKKSTSTLESKGSIL